MNPELGNFALALACGIAAGQAILPLIGAQRRDPRLMALAPALAVGQMLCLITSFACLIHAAITNDFSVQNVAANSAVDKPLLYKITGVWGNHEGSVLLWAMILSICGGAVALFGRNLPSALQARVIAVLGGVAAGFELFCLLTSNPFARVWPAPMDGQGMNPLLQDPGLAFHPPILYTGYVGFAVPFAFAIAALMEGRVDAAWGRWVRPWAVAAWCFLTCGIALGSWWSYYVLGWGGYWFWDPVENASLIPWLTGTALVHSAIVVEKREGLKIWTVLLAIGTFSFSLSGTFLVRSGILNSVHAFANDPARGIFILGLLALVIGGSLLLFAMRAPQLTTGGLFAPVSREGLLVLNNILLCSICAVVLTGTMYPPFMSLLFGKTISVGKPFFDATTIPLAIPLMAFMGFGPMMPWKRAHMWPVLRRLWWAAALALVALVIAVVRMRDILPILATALAVWVIASSATDIVERLRLFRQPLSASLLRARSLPRAVFGAALAHAGVGVTVLGLAGMSQASHRIVEVHIGQTEMLAGDAWTLTDVRNAKGPNYDAMIATIEVRHNGRLITTLHPAKRTFASQHQTTTEVAIHTNLISDTYGVLGDKHGTDANPTYVLRLHHNPLAPWMWLGGLVMAIGGALSLSDRRMRVGAPRRAHAANMVTPA
ncbi:heme lyase CcmF/NrfE family subunit [Novacetimonas hansenii]|uniref:Cytochrome c-type biogenesis protein CycK n=4 Tax=Novacetimonas hansenii TaxID=436 RepID=A0AAW5ETL4_NOVHA|nr:heme lyase CcmF/NrfE family subunit [Novacetimonas hansenii]EFG83465.1 cytochrome c-type biogenesis protein CcmF [Novacetimonas hansenii ATCC 23769]MCJ8354067.1 heme lyase CcmF/NrfE family subunit [Novacetimonas hansenii]GAN83496.1 cytochrome c biogenesis protein CysK/CcmF [Novacetimonas hansenii JCM 7643]GBQ54676.1 cytochrome c-type biogenesis protein CysK [Novacetimonas hansenii NRIC 0243]GEC62732.1 cytochrome c-type biogenesis protein CycK [Novacetimonas hansenii]